MVKAPRAPGTARDIQTSPVSHHTSRTCHWHMSNARPQRQCLFQLTASRQRKHFLRFGDKRGMKIFARAVASVAGIRASASVTTFLEAWCMRERQRCLVVSTRTDVERSARALSRPGVNALSARSLPSTDNLRKLLLRLLMNGLEIGAAPRICASDTMGSRGVQRASPNSQWLSPVHVALLP